MPPAEPLDVKISDLAGKIADAVLAEGVGLDARLDAFKALTAYSLGRKKLRQSDEPPGGEEDTFERYRKQISAQASG